MHRKGETVLEERLSSEELDPDCFETDEDGPEGFRWIITSAVFEKLVYAAVTRLEDEFDYEPRP